MNWRLLSAALGAVVVPLLFLGCDESRGPVQPTTAIRPPAAPAAPAYSISGGVADTAYRPLGGSRVEVISGPRAGTTATTDEGGHYKLSGTFTGDTSLMASRDGYRSQTYTVSPDRFPRHADGTEAWATFYLELPGPAADVAGQYTMTIAADSGCLDLPDAARARTYSATVAHGNRPGFFDVRLTDARFFEYRACPDPICVFNFNWFRIGTAGDFAALPLMIVEVLGGSTHLQVDGSGKGSIEPTGITASLYGSFTHCPTEPILIDQGTWWCPATTAVQCTSSNHRLTLIRR